MKAVTVSVMTAIAKWSIAYNMRSHRATRSISMIALLTGVLLPSLSSAQTQSMSDTATAYGVRLNAKGQPANLNPARINNRIVSRIDNRLALRIERYRPDATNDPAAAFKTTTDDKSRLAPVVSSSQQQNIDDSRQ